MGVSLGSIRDYFFYCFNYIFNHYFGVSLVITLGSLWDHVGISLANGITFKITASECNSKMVLHSVSMLLIVIPKWYYITNHCF